VLLFRLPVLELAVIHDPADGRLGRRSDLDQVELLLLGLREGDRDGDDPQLLAVVGDQADFGTVDLAVQALRLFDCDVSNSSWTTKNGPGTRGERRVGFKDFSFEIRR
jgi:hypothetical protein